MLRLEGPRIVLREWRSNEAEAMHRWRGSPEVMRFLSWGSRSFEESQAHLEECLQDQASALSERERFFLAVEVRENATVIGSAGLHYRSRRYGGGEGGLGWFLETEHQGKGYGTEAARLIVDFGFKHLGLHKVSASCDAGNVGSERIMQKLGMRQEACFRQAHQRFGEWRDRLWYGLLRDEWATTEE